MSYNIVWYAYSNTKIIPEQLSLGETRARDNRLATVVCTHCAKSEGQEGVLTNNIYIYIILYFVVDQDGKGAAMVFSSSSSFVRA